MTEWGLNVSNMEPSSKSLNVWVEEGISGVLWHGRCKPMAPAFEIKCRLLYCSLLLGLLALFAPLCLCERRIYDCFGDVASTWFGLCLGVMHVPGSSAGRHCSPRCTVVLCGLVTLLSVCLAGYPCIFWALSIENGGKFGPGQQTLALVLLSLIWICCMLRQHPASTGTHDAKWCMFAFWLASAAWQFSFILLDNNRQAFICLQKFGCGVQCVALGWTLHLLQIRIVGIGSSVVQPSCSHMWILVMCGCWLFRNTYVSNPHFVNVNLWPFFVSQSVLCTIWVSYMALICRSLSLKLSVLLHETGRVRGPPRKQAIWAAQVLGMEMLICTVLGLTMCCQGIVSGISMYAKLQFWGAPSDAHYRLAFKWMELVFVADNTIWVVNSLGLGLLSGILWQVQPPKDDPQSGCELTRGLVSMASLLIPDEKEAYDRLVQQLANRGFRLGALVGFWERLLDGEAMPGFDPGRSLTNDVVRRAIIPESRVARGGCALATLWSSTETKPQVMVTHNWTNGFGSLVAAILADALGKAAYQEVAAHIATASGLQRVRAKLASKLETTYWVCAFCINQHASICAGFAPEPPKGTPEWAAWDRRRYDSVTGEAFAFCNCQVEKVFSHTDARCELNKFDDMMTHLALEVAGFTQLIVVDDVFDVLYRAWCVAEIFEANVLGMESRIQVSSQDAVDRNYDRLSLLDVRQCTASSEADKEMIMAKISDVEVFNWKIQQLVFSEEMGLFAKWVGGNERSRQVGRIVRRCGIRAESTGNRPLTRPRRCCASIRLLMSADCDSDKSSEDSPLSETSDTFSSSS